MNRKATDRPGHRPRVALYARVSTDTQTVANQLEALKEAGERLGWDIRAEFSDRGISGAKGRAERPQLHKMLVGVTRGEFDLIAAWSVDRLGRSLTDLLSSLGELHAKGCDLYLHQQGIDTSTPAGRAMFQMMGVFAEFEREMIKERVTAGLRQAKRNGTKSQLQALKAGDPHGGNAIGRPRISTEVEERIRALRAEGVGMVRIAKEAGCGVSAVQRVLAEAA